MTKIEKLPLPERVNRERLRAEFIAAGLGDVVISESINWTLPGNVVQSDPAAVEVFLPAGATREQAEALIASHAPEKSDDEERQDQEQSRRAAMRAELRAYMLEFLQDPDLLAMLKQALSR